MEQFISGTKITNNAGSFTGIALATLQLELLQNELANLINDLGAVNGDGMWLFVLGQDGDLVIASTPGIAFSCETGNCVSNNGATSSDPTIKVQMCPTVLRLVF